jgi:hypothetical protein
LDSGTWPFLVESSLSMMQVTVLKLRRTAFSALSHNIRAPPILVQQGIERVNLHQRQSPSRVSLLTTGRPSLLRYSVLVEKEYSKSSQPVRQDTLAVPCLSLFQRMDAEYLW